MSRQEAHDKWDLESERAEYQRALVGAEIDEVLRLRSSPSRRQYG
jgi:hypothetical protein